MLTVTMLYMLCVDNREMGVEPTSTTYSAFLNAYAEKGDLSAMKEVEVPLLYHVFDKILDHSDSLQMGSTRPSLSV